MNKKNKAKRMNLNPKRPPKSAGRPKGVPNKTTTQIREAYQMLLSKNIDNLDAWINQVAEKDPKGAVDLILKLSDFCVPRLARQEIVGKEGEDLFKNIRLKFGNNSVQSPSETGRDN